MTGLFTISTSPLEFYGILRYNGTSWEAVPGFEAATPIKHVMIHDNKLYVAGYFRQIQGAPGNGIAVYDGTSWDNLGGGVLWDLADPAEGYPIILDMLFHEDELIVVGSFNYAGDIPASNVAKWTGDRWCSYGGHFDQTIHGAAVWHDTLYVGGAFSTIDDEPFVNIARWDGGEYTVACSTPVGIEVHEDMPDFSIHPNPTSDLLHISGAHGIAEIIIYDVLGRPIMKKDTWELPGELNVALLASGHYQLHLRIGNATRVIHFIKH